MPEYLAPGVYIEEIEGPNSIQGVSTSTAGFLGFTERGPLKPTLVTNMTQFLNLYGTFLSDWYLAFAVDGFFKNGGRQCFIARIVPGTAKSSEKEAFQISVSSSSSSLKTIDITALGPGAWGNKVYFKIQQASNGNPKNFNLTVIYLKDLPDSSNIVVGSDGGIFTPDPTHPFNKFLKKKVESLAVENYVDLSCDLNSSNYFKKLINGVSNLITVKDNDPTIIPDNILTTRIKIFNFIGIASDSAQKILLKKFLKYFGIDWLDNPDATENFESNAINFKRNSDTNSDTVTIQRNQNFADVLLNGRTIYKFSIESTDDVYSSNIIGLEDGIGADNNDRPKLADYQGAEFDGNEEGVRESSGLRGFEKIKEISIIYSPDENRIQGLRDELIDHCENQKFRFAVLQVDQSANDIGSITIDRETKHAALYYPWLQILHPVTNNLILVPPGGHVAGIYARTDIERGVSNSPAGVYADIRGVVKLQRQILGSEIEILNPRGINSLIEKPGYGTLVYGARTMSTDVNWRYVAIRRLFDMIEKSIEIASERFVFEPNTQRLWSRVIATITPFLSNLRRDGALRGKTDDEAFFVKCDETTMTSEDIRQGKLIIRIGILPAGVAEFVIIQFSQKTGTDTQIEEI